MRRLPSSLPLRSCAPRSSDAARGDSATGLGAATGTGRATGLAAFVLAVRAGGIPGMPGSPGEPAGRAGRPLRICSSCIRAAICWATRAAWMPWKRPSSQPTSCAWAIRSSASLGVCALLERQRQPVELLDQLRAPGRSRARGSSAGGSRSGAARAFSSSGAALTSSSSCLIMLPIRMTLAGCSIRRAGSSSSWPSRRVRRVPRAGRRVRPRPRSGRPAGAPAAAGLVRTRGLAHQHTIASGARWAPTGVAEAGVAERVAWSVLDRPAPPPDLTVPYGDHPDRWSTCCGRPGPVHW